MLDFTCYETHHRVPLVPRVQFSHSNAMPNDGGAPSEMYFAEKYILDMHVSASFYANKANFAHAKAAAEKHATQYLFKNVESALLVIEALAYKHNDHELLEAIGKAKDACRG